MNLMKCLYFNPPRRSLRVDMDYDILSLLLAAGIWNYQENLYGDFVID